MRAINIKWNYKKIALSEWLGALACWLVAGGIAFLSQQTPFGGGYQLAGWVIASVLVMALTMHLFSSGCSVQVTDDAVVGRSVTWQHLKECEAKGLSPSEALAAVSLLDD